MKKALAVMTMSLGLMAAQDSSAETYVKLNGYYYANPGDFDGELSPGVSVGYKFSDQHAIELEAQINGFDDDSPGYEVDADLFTYNLNYQYHFARNDKRSYYLMAGAGTSRPEFGVSPTRTGKDSITVWQVGAGMDYDLGEKSFLNIELRYQDIGEIEDNGVSFDVGSPVVLSASYGYRF